ncbi:MAG: hypothetical protein Q7J21_11895 [Rugosibacter sp.]|nr:hypothetical protein [Rugosibacter sp.]
MMTTNKKGCTGGNRAAHSTTDTRNFTPLALIVRHVAAIPSLDFALLLLCLVALVEVFS